MRGVRLFSSSSRSGRAPLLAICGRPNTGKSTLFNRLCRKNRSLVSATSGTTRDRIYGQLEWLGDRIDVVDTGGMFDERESYFGRDVTEQAMMALDEAHMALLVVDGRVPLDDKDRRVAQLLQKSLSIKPAALVVNKIDSDAILQEAESDKFRRLGLGEPFYVSSLHGDGTLELLSHVHRILYPNSAPVDRKEHRKRLKELAKKRGAKDDEVDEFAEDGEGTQSDGAVDGDKKEVVKRPVRISCVGQPNVGKSSLVNQILGDSTRCLVSPIPGTTHDTVDTELTWKGDQRVLLLDTAGIDRRAKVMRASLERSAVLWALKTIQSADVNVLVLDATVGVTGHEKRIAGHILESKSSVVVAVNKSDLLINQSAKTKAEYEEAVRNELKFMPWVPVVFVSALQGKNVAAVIDKALEVHQQRTQRIPTRRLLDLLQRALLRRSTSGGEKVSFITQAKASHPTFVLFCNDPNKVHFSFERFVENAIREVYPFTGSPITLLWRQKAKKDAIPRSRKRD